MKTDPGYEIEPMFGEWICEYERETCDPLTVHEARAEYPEPTEQAVERIAEILHIEGWGCVDPVYVHNGQIVGGLETYMACRLLDIPVRVLDLPDGVDPETFAREWQGCGKDGGVPECLHPFLVREFLFWGVDPEDKELCRLALQAAQQGTSLTFH